MYRQRMSGAVRESNRPTHFERCEWLAPTKNVLRRALEVRISVYLSHRLSQGWCEDLEEKGELNAI